MDWISSRTDLYPRPLITEPPPRQGKIIPVTRATHFTTNYYHGMTPGGSTIHSWDAAAPEELLLIRSVALHWPTPIGGHTKIPWDKSAEEGRK